MNAAVVVVPSGIHCAPKLHSPQPVTETQIWFSLCQFHESAESSSIVNVTFVPVPLAGTLPVPVHPVQT